jgi:hypothetical protein
LTARDGSDGLGKDERSHSPRYPKSCGLSNEVAAGKTVGRFVPRDASGKEAIAQYIASHPKSPPWIITTGRKMY